MENWNYKSQIQNTNYILQTDYNLQVNNNICIKKIQQNMYKKIKMC